jgi:hypothetical protein
MQPAIRSQHMDVRVKNSYNRQASGTIISKTRDMNCSLVTSIVLKNNVTLVDIVSSRMLGQYGAWQQLYFHGNLITCFIVKRRRLRQIEDAKVLHREVFAAV